MVTSGLWLADEASRQQNALGSCVCDETQQHLCLGILLATCRPSGCTVASGVVGVVVVVVVGVCNCSQMRTSKCTCLIFGVSIGLDHG